MEISVSRYFKVVRRISFKMHKQIENIFFSDRFLEKLKYILRILLHTWTHFNFIVKAWWSRRAFNLTWPDLTCFQYKQKLSSTLIFYSALLLMRTLFCKTYLKRFMSLFSFISRLIPTNTKSQYYNPSLN